ncbi:PAS domain-containing sensor histidine kinase [Filomicrobium sp.]|uniref:PAS domain-containing sensor histidine kinase n=1 Tax=Filomicrobium sp. TaxID=2024831 RepID=UPI00258285F1|nr:PAS domain-containing sensor histidine kinase [Filomicrobium sp.]MCV0368391.1 sensor histidine kinase [Filomicrobium sp.]
MASLIQSFDWSKTELGPMESWPTALKIAVGMMIHSDFPKCIAWGSQLTTIYNDAFKPILGDKPEALGRSFREVWAEVWENIQPICDKAFQGESTFIEDFPLVIDRFGYPEQCYFTFCYSPILDEAGHVVGMLDTVIETTGKVEAERLADVRNSELAHRIRNSLAMVSAIAGQTLRNSDSLETAARSLSNRLQALAKTHSLLTSTTNPSATVSDIIWTALEPHVPDRERFEVSGPLVKLPERQALSMALAVNELATNAVKHGALSTDSGRVLISWALEQDVAEGRMFHFHWAEADGPPCRAPSRKSFGTVLLETVVPADFQGQARLDYGAECFQYTLISNLDRFDDVISARP